jgi:GAF domain-containing protein
MMMPFFSPPAKPATETWRLKRLQDMGVLDTAPDPVLDAITAQAATLFDTPIALVSLIDARRQWFKARHGLGAPETPRSVSFCGHAILGDQPLVVLDATQDERFAGNPLVTGAPHVIFYAGVPLVTDDHHCLGTLCVIDSKPREKVDEDALEQLRRLADDVVVRMELLARSNEAS